jgi:hypothetical protein
MVLKELFKNGDETYIIIRKIPVHNFIHKKTNAIIPEVFNLWKEHLGADKVLKHNETFLFCETVPEAELINEHNEEQ